MSEFEIITFSPCFPADHTAPLATESSLLAAATLASPLSTLLSARPVRLAYFKYLGFKIVAYVSPASLQ
jgi:hypothetical protein